jgi:hypothetical protein
MSPDYLAAITAFADAWEAALALLWQRVNAFLAKHGCNVELPVGQLPAGLDLNGAIGKLRVAAREIRRFRDDVPEEFLRLMIGEFPWTIDHAAAADSHLQQLANGHAKVGCADPWTWPPVADILWQNYLAAEDIRASLTSEIAKATADSLDEKDKEVLQALELLKAFDENTRRTAEKIAERVEGRDADSQAYKKRLSDLANRKRLLGSKGGRGGGSWLNPLGRAVISFLRPT